MLDCSCTQNWSAVFLYNLELHAIVVLGFWIDLWQWVFFSLLFGSQSCWTWETLYSTSSSVLLSLGHCKRSCSGSLEARWLLLHSLVETSLWVFHVCEELAGISLLFCLLLSLGVFHWFPVNLVLFTVSRCSPDESVGLSPTRFTIFLSLFFGYQHYGEMVLLMAGITCPAPHRIISLSWMVFEFAMEFCQIFFSPLPLCTFVVFLPARACLVLTACSSFLFISLTLLDKHSLCI